jgi:hypothetical protein
LGVGPILIFDKSTLQSLAVDEAVWLDTFYLPNITPLFFVETLADLEKEVAEGRTPEQVVGHLAEKTPLRGAPNAHHASLCLANLLGHPVAMDGRKIHLAGGRRVVAGGRRGVVIENPPEMEALVRWQQGEFLDVERLFAKVWRRALAGLDLGGTKARLIGGERIRDLADAKRAADEILRRDGERYVVLRWALDALQIPPAARGDIIRRWKAAGDPHLVDFAPYAAHVFAVELFFALAMGSGLESSERPTHKVDIAYLYYLPFCMVFASNDRLHERVVPLFLSGRQVFLRGSELKSDLAKLDEYYSAMPEEVKQQGIIKFAFYPPVEGDFLVSRLWDRFMVRDWRDRARQKPQEIQISKEAQENLIEELKRMKDAARQGESAEVFDSDEADQLLRQIVVPVRRGKWRLLPPEVEGKEHERNS